MLRRRVKSLSPAGTRTRNLQPVNWSLHRLCFWKITGLSKLKVLVTGITLTDIWQPWSCRSAILFTVRFSARQLLPRNEILCEFSQKILKNCHHLITQVACGRYFLPVSANFEADFLPSLCGVSFEVPLTYFRVQTRKHKDQTKLFTYRVSQRILYRPILNIYKMYHSTGVLISP